MQHENLFIILNFNVLLCPRRISMCWAKCFSYILHETVFIKWFQSFSFSLALTNERVSKRKLKARMKKKIKIVTILLMIRENVFHSCLFCVLLYASGEKKEVTPMLYAIYHKYEYGILFLWPTFSAAHRSLSSSLNIW